MKLRNIMGIIFWCMLMPLGHLLILMNRLTLPKPKLLIIPTPKIGDLVCQCPIFREFKKVYPEIPVTIIVKKELAALVKKNPYIDRIIYFENTLSRKKRLAFIFALLRDRYTWSIKLNAEPWFDIVAFYALIPHRISVYYPYQPFIVRVVTRLFNDHLAKYNLGNYSTQVYLNTLCFLGIDTTNTVRKVYIADDDRKSIKNYVQKLNLNLDDLNIGISISCRNKFKEWNSEKFLRLSALLVDKYRANIFLTGTKNDRDKAEKIIPQGALGKVFNTCGEFTLGQFMAFCEWLDIVISVDSGPIYIAEAISTPLIDIAGPIDVREQPPRPSKKVKIVQLNLECIPCSHVGILPESCKLNSKDCLDKLKLEDVLNAVDELIEYIQAEYKK